MRAVARLTAEIGERKTRIRALAAALMPTVDHALGKPVTRADLAVLARWGDPRALQAVSLRRLTAVVAKASGGHSGEEKARAFHAAAEQALALWAGDSAVALADLAAELATEIRLLHAAEIERAEHETVRDAALAKVDPEGLAASLPGVGPVGASVLTAVMGRPGRFPNAAAFKQFTGLAPRANQTGDTDRKGQPMSKAGPRGLRSVLIRCADTARKQDPQLAAVYHQQMTTRNAPHLKALCVVAARLAERAWVTLADGQPYQLRDVDGTPVTAEEAKRVIAERYTVPPEVRRRRRSGRAEGEDPSTALGGREVTASGRTRGDLPHRDRAAPASPGQAAHLTRRRPARGLRAAPGRPCACPQLCPEGPRRLGGPGRPPGRRAAMRSQPGRPRGGPAWCAAPLSATSAKATAGRPSPPGGASGG